ncbi:MAG: hypothetical protein CMJ46_10865 [Planctomyces sp.]|nr:hypothetical protein [Planctomyces sp.]
MRFALQCYVDEDLHAVFLPKRLLPLFKAGDTIEALTERLWNYAIDTVEQRGDALLEKSRWLVEVGRLGEARAVCEEALRLDPANPQLQQAAAEWEMAGIRAESESISSSATAEKRERLRRAESLVEQAIAQTAADFALWLLRAEIQMYEGRPRQAEDTLRKGWSLIAAAEKSSSINADSPENMETKDFAKLEARFVWALANLIVQQMENDSAGQPQRLDEFERLLQRLESLSVPAANVDYLRGRSLFAQQRWHSARQVLAEASREMDRRSSILGHLHLLLSKSNRRLGLFEQEVSVLRDAIENSRDSASIRLQMADLLRSHGEVSEASEWLEWLPVEDYGDASRLARVTILCEAARPPANRRPHVLEAAIQHAKRCGVPAAEMAFYEADVALLLQKPDEAGRILESLRDAQPDHPEAWVMLALFHARHPDGNGFAQANTILRNAEQHLGPDPSFFRARLIIVVNLPQAEAISALTQLAAEPLASLPSSADLAFELAAAFEHCGQITAAHHWFRMAANHAPINLRYRFESARLLAALGRWPEFENSLIQLGEIEGADGPLGGYLRAVAVIVAREQKILQQKEIQSAHEHLDAAEEARWRWYFVPLARSILLHLEHNREAAGLQREHAEQLAAAAGRTIRDTSPPSQALLGSEVFPVGEWTRDIMSQPLIAFYLDETSLTFVKFDESSGVNSEDAGRTAQLAFAGIDFERITLTSGNSGSAHEQAETRVTAGLRSIVDQVADSKSSISTRVFVVTLASLGLVLVVNTILFERVGPFWGLLILIPGSLITFPVCYICLSWFFQNFL